MGLPEHEIGRYTKDILRGLDHIHSRGIVHCDIQADNTLLVAGKDAFRSAGISKQYFRRRERFLSKCFIRVHQLRWTAKHVLAHPFPSVDE
ncbi:hypothetical protein CUMW_131480 [Citrus unshiu]|uniref:Protein kinase domain-containing protein n=1 Tax=Citrus unshiu TaxID=55188 RepID=A0A2H5PFE4_CITUN|nr:hypothetical protein CUMW_131480 [Citrus unshiu]